MNKLTNYVKASIQEMKKVTWPTKKEVRTYTLVIIALSAALAVYFGALDFIFNKIFNILVIK